MLVTFLQDRSRINFWVGDACSLPDDIGQFGLVLAANLLCRLRRPLDFLNRTKDLVLPSGILILTTPFTWMEKYTSKVTAVSICVCVCWWGCTIVHVDLLWGTRTKLGFSLSVIACYTCNVLCLRLWDTADRICLKSIMKFISFYCRIQLACFIQNFKTLLVAKTEQPCAHNLYVHVWPQWYS